MKSRPQKIKKTFRKKQHTGTCKAMEQNRGLGCKSTWLQQPDFDRYHKYIIEKRFLFLFYKLVLK